MQLNLILVATTAFLGSALALPQAEVTSSVSARPTRSIHAGTVIGKATPVVSVSQTATVYNYLGIPFAAAPTGTLRFQPPQTSITFSAPVQATAFPPACLQQLNATAGGPDDTVRDLGPPDSEDCLYLNVFAPTDASTTNRKPVLFWIYGGNLAYGTGSTNFYNGSSFAGFQDVIVVTFNYRTNIFGFSNSPDIASGLKNSGYLDQRAALQWTYDNIASFGGDPGQITIFGESSGGYSVKQLLAHPPWPLNYRAAIIQSDGLLRLGDAAANYEQVATYFNCSSGPGQLACFQNVSGTDIINYIIANNTLFYPADDNVTQSNDVRPSIKEHQWADVPYLIGNNGQEGRLFTYSLFQGLNNTLQSVLDLLIPNNPQLQQTVSKAYGAVSNDVYEVASRLITDLTYNCPTAVLARYTLQHGYPDVWRYYYNGSFPNLSYFPNAGAYHTSEIPQVFGTYELSNYLGPSTADQEGLSGYMQAAWANFAKDPGNGPGWPLYSTPGNNVGNLGGINKTGEVTVPESRTDALCLVLNPIILVDGF